MNHPYFQQITLEQAQGKGFNRLLISKCENQILILFRDQTFAVLNIKCWSYGVNDISESSDSISMESITERYYSGQLIEAGLATKEEIEQQEAERQREWRESCKARDIARLKELQALYPDVQ